MAEYRSKYTGAEVDALLGKVESGDVGGKVTVDSALSTESENPVMNKVITEELGNKADKDGVYSGMTVGTADDLAGRGESVPASFGFRASGGKSIKDGRAYIKRIKGNSVVWNQLWDINGDNRTDNVANMTINEREVVLTLQSIGTNNRIRTAYTIGVVGHKYYVTYQAKYNSKSDDSSLIAFVGMSNSYANQLPLTNSYQTYSGIWVGDYAGAMNVGVIGTRNDGDIVSFKDIKVTDLTQLFQAGNEPTTIEEFYARKPIVEDEYAYNEGEVIHCNTESIKSVGDNAWDEEWETGTITTADGIPHESEVMLRSKNYIKVLPSQTYHYLYSGAIKEYALIYFYDDTFRYISYYSNWKINHDFDFTTPPNCCYIKFVEQSAATYKNDIMIRLDHSGWKSNTGVGYEPYWQDTLPLPIIRKYFPQGMKSAGSAHDEIRYNKASGKWEAVQRIGSVDMGDMAWGYNSDNNVFSSYTLMDLMTHPAELSERAKGLLCSNYSPSRTYVAQTMDDKSWLRIPKSVTIKDTTYTDAATFKAAMQGVMLYYELAEPIVTELDAEDQNFRDYYNVADFGTEMSQSSVPSAPFSADIIYQFNAVDMIREHEIEINELQSIIATMQAQLASLTSNNA